MYKPLPANTKTNRTNKVLIVVSPVCGFWIPVTSLSIVVGVSSPAASTFADTLTITEASWVIGSPSISTVAVAVFSSSPLSSAVTVEQLVYYDADGKINGVPQSLNITIPSGTAIGTSINTGITPTMVQNYARFQLSSSYLVDNPIVDLTKASDGEQVLPK